MEKPIKPSAGRLVAALFVPLAVLVAGYYAAKGEMGDLGGAALRLTLDVPSDVTIAAGRETPVDLTLALTNRTGQTMTLTASDPCKVLRWVVQSPGDVFVQSKGEECVPESKTREIASGEVIERRETIRLDNKRYKSGVTYTVFVQFYGQEGTARFSIPD